MGYWRRVHRTALQKTRRLLGLESAGQILVRILLGIALIAALALWGSEDAASDEILGRTVLLALIVLLVPVVYLLCFAAALPGPFMEMVAQNGILNSRMAELERLAELIEAKIIMRMSGTVAGSGNTALCFWVSVRNLGNRASSVVDWRMRWSYDGQPMWTNADYFDNMHLEKTVTLNAEDNITEKTINPVQPGAIVNGWFYKVFESAFDVGRFEDVVLTAETVTGTTIEARYEAGNSDIGYVHPPGIKSRREFD